MLLSYTFSYQIPKADCFLTHARMCRIGFMCLKYSKYLELGVDLPDEG